MTTTSAEKILRRARELNIVIWLENDKIKCRGHGAVPPKMVEVLRANKAEIIAYLQSQEDAMEVSEPDLCVLCLDQNIETPACFVGPQDLMYCHNHYQTLPQDWRKADLERYAAAMRLALPGWKVTVEPRRPLAEHLQQRPSQEQKRDYWAETQRKLTQQGYYGQVNRDLDTFRNRVEPSRVHLAPFPAYQLVEVDGVKRLQVVGKWHNAEYRLLTEEEQQVRS